MATAAAGSPAFRLGQKRGHHFHCPNCDPAMINPQRVDLDMQIARCADCGESFKVGDLLISALLFAEEYEVAK